MDYIKSFSDFLTERGELEKTSNSKKYITAKTKKEQNLMKHEIKKHAHKEDDDPSAYKKWPADYKGGDTSGEKHDTKKSKSTIAYQKKYKQNEDLNEDSRIKTALKNKEKETGFPYSILKQVHDRGMAAWKTGHFPGTTQAQWAMGRVNSFITGEGGARKADKDLWDEYKGKNK